MFKKIVSFFAVLLFGAMLLSPTSAISSIWSGGQMIGTGQPGVDAAGEVLMQAGASMACKERCPCTPNNNHNSVFFKTMEEYAQENSGACWYCDIFMKLFQEVNKMATAIFDRLSTSFLTLLGLGLLFLILFKVGRLVLQFKAVDVMQFLNDLFKPLGRGIIASALLLAVTSQTDNVFSMITSPIFETSVKIGNIVMDAAIPGNVAYLHQGTGINTYTYQPQRCENINTAPLNGENGVFTKGQGQVLRCWMEQVASSFITGIAIGSSLVSVGIEGTGLLGNMTMILTGALIMLCFWLLYLVFPFKLIDAFVRMAFILTLMPLWIILWVFPLTASYTKRAWEMFLSAGLYLITLSILVSLTVILMSNSIPENDRKGLITCLLAGNDQSAATWVLLGSGALLNTLFFFCLSWSLLGMAEPLANNFVNGGGSLGIGDGLVATGAKAVDTAINAGKGIGNAALLGIGAIGGLAASAGRRSGGGSSGGGSSGGSGTGDSTPASHRGTFSGGSDNQETTADTSTENQNSTADEKPTDSGDKKPTENEKPTKAPNTQTSASDTQQTVKPMDKKTAEEKEALRQAKEEQAKIQLQEQNPERSTEKINQEERAKDSVKQSKTAEQNTHATTEIETQRQRQSETTGLKMTRREEAIYKLRENPTGSQIVRDTAANIAFIQDQMQSAHSVGDLNDKLKGHEWQYSGNDREGYARMMARSAETMMNSYRFGISDSMNYKIKDMLTDAFKHGNIADADELVNAVMEKVSGNPAFVSEILNNLTKKE